MRDLVTSSDVRSYTPPAAARRLGLHHSTLRRWCEDQKIRAFRMPSGHWRIPRDVVAELAGRLAGA